MYVLVLGSEINTRAGTSLFEEVGPAFAAFGGLAVATAILALTIAVLRFLIQPTDDQMAATINRVRRVLTILVFFSTFGMIVTWISGNLSEAPIIGQNYLGLL